MQCGQRSAVEPGLEIKGLELRLANETDKVKLLYFYAVMTSKISQPPDNFNALYPKVIDIYFQPCEPAHPFFHYDINIIIIT